MNEGDETMAATCFLCGTRTSWGDTYHSDGVMQYRCRDHQFHGPWPATPAQHIAALQAQLAAEREQMALARRFVAAREALFAHVRPMYPLPHTWRVEHGMRLAALRRAEQVLCAAFAAAPDAPDEGEGGAG